MIDRGRRRSGRSTRIIDTVIQELFSGKTVKVQDHYPDRKAHEHLLSRIIKRLESEHPNTSYAIKNGSIKLISR